MLGAYARFLRRLPEKPILIGHAGVQAHVPWGLSNAARIDFRRPHAPLLFVAGTADHIMPASLNYATYQLYNKYNNSITDYEEFTGRNHLVLGLPTWREEADTVLA